MYAEPRHLHVPAGRAARGGRDAVWRVGAVHQPLLPTQLRRRDRRGGPPPAHHHLRQATHRARGRGRCSLHAYILFTSTLSLVSLVRRPIWHSGGFDSRTVHTFVCMNMSDCIGSGCFYV
jgi:hypothetical protein